MDIDEKFKGIKSFFGSNKDNSENENNASEEYYTTSKEEYHVQNGMAGSKMMLLEPRAYSESQQIADYLKNRNAVVVNLKRVTPDQAKRIVDFLSGTLYAINGGLQKLGTGIFLCTPNNIDVEGSISDESKEKNIKKDIKNEEEEADW